MADITFRFEDGTEKKISAIRGDNLLEVARRANVIIDAPCSGNGSCGKCRVRMAEGDVESAPSRHVSQQNYDKGWRVSCQSRVIGDAVVEVPDIASAYKGRMKTADLSSPEEVAIFEKIQSDIAAAGLEFSSGIYTVQVALDEPTLDDTLPDNERLLWALRAQIGKEEILLPYSVMKDLSWLLRENNFTIRVVLEKHEEGQDVIMAILPSEDDKPVCGLAVDIGTTTVAAVLTNIETGELVAKGSTGNGQIRFGADVINRIIESCRPGGRERLRRAVIDDTLDELIEELCRQCGLGRERIFHVVIAGNTTMNHLALGLYADPVRMEPYIPSFFSMEPIPANEVIPGLPGTSRLMLAPNVGSYVGGDITAGALASMIWNTPELTLFIDLGTNGELVIGNEEFLMTCACSAGPAFEGGDISCGMRATYGAIEAVTIDPQTYVPNLSIIGEEDEPPIGLCGSGLIDIIAEMFKTGVVDSRGKFVLEHERVRHDEHGIGSYVIAFAGEFGNELEITINEVDLDNFIRAKGAIFSAQMLMLGQLGFTPMDAEHIYIAGGIGSGIDFENSVLIGMLPDIPRDKFHYIGNSSLAGAYAMLQSTDAKAKVDELGMSMTYVELSNEPGYMDEFVAACFLPHTNASLFPSVTGA